MAIKNRYEFVLYYDVVNGNPNGDPDANNMPRINVMNGKGQVSAEAIKRKIRDYVATVKGDAPGYEIYIANDGVLLNDKNKRAYQEAGIKPSQQMTKEAAVAGVNKYMDETFFDVRTFGAVMSTAVNCGQRTGPVQVFMSESTHPITPVQMSIGRVAITHEKDEDKKNTFGEKFVVPYALYRLEGTVSPHKAEITEFSEEDLELVWQALMNMFDLDRSAARGKMTSRKLYVFKHDSMLGNAPSTKLFDLVTATTKDDLPPTEYADCSIMCDKDNVPRGVTLLELL